MTFFFKLLFSSIRCVCNLFQELKETEELDIQLKVFNENKEEDSIELNHRLDDIRAEMEYPFYLPLCECRGLRMGLYCGVGKDLKKTQRLVLQRRPFFHVHLG